MKREANRSSSYDFSIWKTNLDLIVNKIWDLHKFSPISYTLYMEILSTLEVIQQTFTEQVLYAKTEIIS